MFELYVSQLPLLSRVAANSAPAVDPMEQDINWDEVKFDFTGFMADHWLTYILIFIFLVYIYNKVFRVRKLPILKDVIVYGLIALGAFLLLIFQVDANLPILASLSVAVALMLTVRIRYYFIDRANKKTADPTDKTS